MNVFIPYPSPLEVAKTMWADQRRYNKAIIECKQILAAIDGAKAWRNHPVCLMYKKHREWLYDYMMCFSFYREYKKGNNDAFKYCCCYDNEAHKIQPTFISLMCIQHRKRLYTKSPELYPQFAEYGTSEENWYYVENQIVKYVNGKRIN